MIKLLMSRLFGHKSQSEKYYQVLDFHVDFSRHWLNEEVIQTLLSLAEESQLEQHIQSLFCGDIVNPTENRAALHTALRNYDNDLFVLKDASIHKEVKQALDKMKQFCDNIHQHKHLGYNNCPITDIVHIGIGGSYLGPEFVHEALQEFTTNDINIHFLPAVDNYPKQTHPILQSLQPQNTLFILASKSFTTKELILNANLAKRWFVDCGGDEQAIDKHFVALTANIDAAIKFGISAEHIFPMWDWIGGRYSVWSAIGLPVMLSVGYDNFIKLLAPVPHKWMQHFYHALLGTKIFQF